MALDCSAESLAVNSAKLTGSLSFKQLLAALVYIQCTSNGMSCDAETLSEASHCLYNCLSEKQLIAALVYIQCTSGGGGGGGSISSGAGAPIAAPSSSPAIYIDENSGVLYSYYGGAWH